MASQMAVSIKPAAQRASGRVAPSRQSRLRAAAHQDGERKEAAPQAPSNPLIKALGVLAAANLAISGAPALAEDLLPASAESATARAEVNRETSNAPSFTDVGNSLSKQFNTDDPKEVGRAVDRATPDVDLTQNPKDLTKQAGKAIQEALPNVSDVPKSEADSPNPFDKGGATIPRTESISDLRSKVGGASKAASDVGDAAKGAAKEAGKAAQEVTGKVSLDLPNPFQDEAERERNDGVQLKNVTEKAEQLGSKVGLTPAGGDVGKSVGNAAAAKGEQAREAAAAVGGAQGKDAFNRNNTRGDLSLSNPFASGPEKAGQEAKSAVKDAGREASKLGVKLPNPSEVGDVAKAKSKEAARNVKQVTGNVSVSNPFASGPEKAAQEAKSAVNDAGREASKLGAKLPNPSEVGDVAKAKSKEAARNVKQVTGNVSVSNPFASGPEKAAQEAKSAVNDAGREASKLGAKLPNPSEVGDVAKAKSKEAARNVKQVTGNVSDLPNPFKAIKEGAAPPTQTGPSVTNDSDNLGRPLQIKDVEKSQPKFPSPYELTKMDRGEAQSAAERFGQETGGNLPKAADLAKNVPSPGELTNKLPDVGLPDVKQAAQNASSKVQEAAGNLSLSNPFASGPEKAGQEAKSAVNDAGREASKLGAKLPNPSEVGDVAKAKGKEAARNVKQVTGNVSDLPSPQELAKKATDAAKGAQNDASRNLPNVGKAGDANLPGSKTTAKDLGLPKNS